MLPRLFLKLVAILPLWLSRLIGGQIALLVGLLKPKDFNIAQHQISFALALDQAESLKLAKKSFKSVGENVADALQIPRILAKHGYNGEEKAKAEQFPNFELKGDSEQILRNGWEKRGSVIISGHIGCIEILAAYYVARGLDLYAIGRSPNKPWIDNWVTALRESYRVKTIWRDDPGSAMKILKALRSGGTITALIDQDTKLESVYSPFFGLDAAIPSGLIALAVKKNIPILSCFIVRSGPDNYEVHSKHIDYDSNSPDVLSSIAYRYNQELEKVISLFPEQWVWWHKRWRRRPGVDYKTNPNKLKNSVDYCDWMASISENNLKTINQF